MIRYLASFLMWCGLFKATLSDVEIKNITVTVTAEDAVTAKNRAMDKAYTDAFNALTRQVIPEQYWPQLGATPISDIKNLTKSFSQQMERTTATTYKTTLAVVFDGEKLTSFLKVRNIEAIPVPQKPYLLVPVIKVGAKLGVFDVDNPFLTQPSAIFEKSAVRVVMPLGDLEDVTTLSPDTLYQGKYRDLKKLLQRYQVNEVIVVIVDKITNSRVNLQTTFVNFDGKEPWAHELDEVAVTADNSTLLNQSMFQEVHKQIADYWRTMFTASTTDKPKEKVVFYASNLKEVLVFEKYLKEAPFVEKYDLLTLNAQEREYQITFKTLPDKFIFTLQNKGYKVLKETNSIKVYPNAKTAS